MKSKKIKFISLYRKKKKLLTMKTKRQFLFHIVTTSEVKNLQI